MTQSEQGKMMHELKGLVSSMNRDDAAEFDMLLKRDKDGEDLDSIAIGKLEHLHHRYVRKKSKKDVEALWAKLTQPKRPPGEE